MARSPRIRLAGPAPTIRLRLTVLYGLVFLVSGAVLLTIGYIFVRNNLSGGSTLRDELSRLGLPPRPPNQGPFGADASVFEALRRQLRADALHRLLIEYLLALGGMTMVSVAAGWLLAGRALRPLRDITATARRVSGENLGERISLEGPADELKELADTFDGMLGRLDAAFESQRHFVASASHELRTPLAIMRTEVDVALGDPDAPASELRAMGEALRETIDRCERLIDGLLFLARSEAATGREEPVDMAALAGDCITDLHAHAVQAQVEVHDDLAPAWTRGQPELIERMIANLLENGIRHNVPGGHLNVSTGTRAGRAWVVVVNGGPRIDPKDAASLVEPFRRLGAGGGGFGLGLSIVRSVAVAHGGVVSVLAPEAGGLEVRIDLPASQPGNVVLARSTGALTGS